MSKKYPILLSLVLLSIGYAGCRKKAYKTDQVGHVKGHLIDSKTNRPLAGVKIQIEGCKRNFFGSTCRDVSEGLTGPDGSFSLSFKGNGTATYFRIQVEKTDSIWSDRQTETRLRMSHNNDVTLSAFKYQPVHVRLTVHKNEGAHLSLQYRLFSYTPILLRTGPVDTAITVWGPADAGLGILFTLAAPDPQSGIYKGKTVNIPLVPQDTFRVEVGDMMALPEMPDYRP